MADVNDLLIRIDATTEQLRREMKRAERSVDSGSRRIDRSARRIDKSFASLHKGAMRLAGAFGIAFGFRGLAGGISSQLEAADNLVKLTERIGGTTEALSELQFVSERSGVSFNTMTMGLQRMTRRLGEASKGKGEARGALRELNLEAETLVNLSLDQQFETIADALSRVENQAHRAALAQKVFDSEGVALLQTMTDGAEGIRKLREEAARLGVTLDTDQAQAAVRARDSITNLSASWDALARTLTLKVAPALTQVFELMNKGFNPPDFSIHELAAQITVEQMRVTELTEQLKEAQEGLAEEEGGRIQMRAALRRHQVAALEEELNEASGKLSSLQAQMEEFHRDRERREQDASGGGVQRIPRLSMDDFNIHAIPELDRPQTELLDILGLQRADAEQAARDLTNAFATEAERSLDEASKDLRLAEKLFDQELISEETLNRVQERLDEVTDSIDGKFKDLGLSLGRSMIDSTADAFMGIETNFGDMIKRMAARATATQLFSAIGGAVGGPVGSFFANAAKFEHGGSFKVGGAGGPDSKLVAFRATPGEDVTVTPPGKGRGSGFNQNVTVNIQTGLPSQIIPELEAIGFRAGAMAGQAARSQRPRPSMS